MNATAPLSRYRAVYRTVRRREAAAQGLAARGLRALLFVAVTVALLPLVQPVFLAFLDEAPSTWADGLAGAWGRAGLLLLAVAGLSAHGTVLRGPARAALSLHPVDPAAVTRVELEAAARGLVPLVAATAVLALPIARTAGIVPWALGVAVVAGAAALGLVAGALALLGAIAVAEDPRWAPLLDGVRGNNPRPQAALIYALAPSTLIGGWLVMAAADGAVALGQGRLAGAVWVALPWIAAAIGLGGVPSLARRTWFPASAVLAEVRARYDAVEHPEEARRVYLDWTVRWLPDGVGRLALLLFRYGWRARRAVVSALWLAALGAVAAGWTDADGGPLRAGLVAAIGAWWVGSLAVFQARDEPQFLGVWLPRPPALALAATAWCVVAWALGPALVGAAAVAVRVGPGAAVITLGVAVGHAAVAGGAASVCARWRGRGLAPYVAGAVLAGAGTAAALLGGGA
ncbi:MAG: hypothetical protein H6733_08150 [Alphaproteobacteria bacterium]|nr:hypothetical protein [Alphaproteobacteria bacterium]